MNNILNTGIYQITNLTNGKSYIGSAVNIRKRWNKHKSELKFNRHHAPHLQYAWNKYQEPNFEFKILLNCNKEYLIEFEQLYLDEIKPEYNVAKIAGKSALGSKRTKEQCINISNGLKGHTTSEETKEKIRIGNRKKTISEEHKNAISKFQKDKPKSEETRTKMGAWQVGRKLSKESCNKMSATKQRKKTIREIVRNWGCAL